MTAVDPRRSSDFDVERPWPATEGAVTATVPHCDMTDEEIEGLQFDYPDHDPATSFVVSGPLGAEGHGPGRRFPSWQRAYLWASMKYGSARRINDAEPGGRWAMRVPRPAARSDDATE